MSYIASVIEVMIASTGEMAQERDVVREIVAEWNDLNARVRRIVLLATGWETHSAPALDGRPQQLINETILAHSDLVVAIVGSRIGTPTGEAVSGTVEEIQKHYATGKPLMLYFARPKVDPDQFDQAQWDEVKKLREWAANKGLYCPYTDLAEFRNLLRQHLARQIATHPHLVAATTGHGTRMPHLAVRDIYLEDAAHMPQLEYPKKLRIVVTNTSQSELKLGPNTVWRARPGCIADRALPQQQWQHEGGKGWLSDNWQPEQPAVTLAPGRTARTWIGLHNDATDVEVRRHTAVRTLGDLLIPVSGGSGAFVETIEL